MLEGDDGRILLTCHADAGCSTESICAALSLELKDLFVSSTNQSSKRIAATYDYRDEFGKLLFEAVRYEPKSFSQRRPDGAGGWKWNLEGVRRVLYRLPELTKAHADATVFLTEGEKDADQIQSLGLVSTTNPMGAGKWRDEYSQALAGRDVVILPDNDDSGLAHAHEVAVSLYRVARSVKLLLLPDLAKKGDVSDWIDAGGDAEALCVLAENAPEWTPESAESRETPPVDTLPFYQSWRELNAEHLPPGEQIIFELERGELGLCNAVTSVGKSTLIRNAAIALACGRLFLPIVTERKARKVMILDFEARRSRLQRDLRQMVKQLSDDERRMVDENLAIVCGGLVDDEPLCLTEKSHLEFVRNNIRLFGADLLIVDTVSGGFALFDENSNAEVTRRVMKPMSRLAQETATAIWLAHHTGKPREDGSTEKAYKGRGASAFGTFPTVVFDMTRDPHNEDRKVLSLAKTKGQRFDDVVLELNRDTRWFATGRRSGLDSDQLRSRRRTLRKWSRIEDVRSGRGARRQGSRKNSQIAHFDSSQRGRFNDQKERCFFESASRATPLGSCTSCTSQ